MSGLVADATNGHLGAQAGRLRQLRVNSPLLSPSLKAPAIKKATVRKAILRSLVAEGDKLRITKPVNQI